MKGSDIFPSKYISADDLQDRDVAVVISLAVMEKLGDDNKLVLYFRNKDKGMVCNKTNYDRIAMLHGDETDAWPGKPITLTTEFTQFNGRTMKGLRVKPAMQSTRAPARHLSAPQPMSENPRRLDGRHHSFLGEPWLSRKRMSLTR